MSRNKLTKQCSLNCSYELFTIFLKPQDFQHGGRSAFPGSVCKGKGEPLESCISSCPPVACASHECLLASPPLLLPSSSWSFPLRPSIPHWLSAPFFVLPLSKPCQMEMHISICLKVSTLALMQDWGRTEGRLQTCFSTRGVKRSCSWTSCYLMLNDQCLNS